MSIIALAAFLSNQEMTAKERKAFDDFAQTAINIKKCKRIAGETCTWKAITYRMTDQYEFDVTVPGKAGPNNWTITCRRDKVESTLNCSLRISTKGGSLRVSRGPGDDRLFWGGDAYPGSQKVVRFGNGKPIRFREDERIDAETNEAMLNLMMAVPSAIFRWQTWPDNIPSDIEVDLAHFGELLTFFHAATLEYSTQE